MTLIEASAGPINSDKESALRVYEFVSIEDTARVVDQVGQLGERVPGAPARLVAAIGSLPTLSSIHPPGLTRIGKALEESPYSTDLKEGLEHAVDTLERNKDHTLSENAEALLDAVFREVVDEAGVISDKQIIGAPGVFIENGIYVPGFITSSSIRRGMENRLGKLNGRLSSRLAHDRYLQTSSRRHTTRRETALAWWGGHVFEQGLEELGPVFDEIGVTSTNRELYAGNIRGFLRKQVKLDLLTTDQAKTQPKGLPQPPQTV